MVGADGTHQPRGARTLHHEYLEAPCLATKGRPLRTPSAMVLQFRDGLRVENEPASVSSPGRRGIRSHVREEMILLNRT